METITGRSVHLLANLDWVDFDLGCSPILPSSSASSVHFLSAQAEGGTAKIKVNPTKVRQDMDLPPRMRSDCQGLVKLFFFSVIQY